jgi:hypothetical protein
MPAYRHSRLAVAAVAFMPLRSQQGQRKRRLGGANVALTFAPAISPKIWLFAKQGLDVKAS